MKAIRTSLKLSMFRPGANEDEGPDGSQTRHTSSRGNVGAAEDLKREKGE
jgi:hypothetical protein